MLLYYITLAGRFGYYYFLIIFKIHGNYPITEPEHRINIVLKYYVSFPRRRESSPLVSFPRKPKVLCFGRITSKQMYGNSDFKHCRSGLGRANGNPAAGNTNIYSAGKLLGYRVKPDNDRGWDVVFAKAEGTERRMSKD